MAQSIARKYASVFRSAWPLLSSNKITARCMATGKPKKKVSGQLSQNSDRTLTYREYDEGISITFGAESRQLPFLWLRDHCRSKDSYNHNTHQKIILPHRIDPNIKPTELKIEGNKLVVYWPEGLRSTYAPPTTQCGFWKTPSPALRSEFPSLCGMMRQYQENNYYHFPSVNL